MNNRQADLVIRGGTVVDGRGCEPFVADISVKDGIIVAVGQDLPAGADEIDAHGLLVTPGFVDIHTHYDGQVTWDERTMPSSIHGVTTVVMGNCGVGFAPCRPEDRTRLIDLMKAVEDIPEVVMEQGVPWTWETFPEYLDVVAARRRDVDVAAQLPHSALRVYVMGERAVDREAATDADLQAMKRIAREAMEAGAIGFASSRTLAHRNADGQPIPSLGAEERELLAIAEGLAEVGPRMIEIAIDQHEPEAIIDMMQRLSLKTGASICVPIVQFQQFPGAWNRLLSRIDTARESGADIKAQVLTRPTGVLMGLDFSYHPLCYFPGYREIEHLPLDERVREMLKPEVRERILSGTPIAAPVSYVNDIHLCQNVYLLDNPPNYEPSEEYSLVAIAEREGRPVTEVAYDLLVKDGGHGVLVFMLANFGPDEISDDPVLTMLKDPNTILGLGDAGAHYGMICDASYPTFLLTHWTQTRDGERFSLPEVVKWLSNDTASAFGLRDRGVIAPGYKADFNLIDYKRLSLGYPKAIYDLPGGGRRLIQQSIGYVATILSGQVTYREGSPTGALPGTLIRGPQQALQSA